MPPSEMPLTATRAGSTSMRGSGGGVGAAHSLPSTAVHSWAVRSTLHAVACSTTRSTPVRRT